MHVYLDFYQWLTVSKGMPPELANIIMIVFKAVVIILLCIIINVLAKSILLRGVRTFVHKTKTEWDDMLEERHVFDRLSQIAPALVLYIALPLSYGEEKYVEWLQRLALVWIVVVGARVFLSFLNAIQDIYRTFEQAKRRPIRGYLQAIKILIFIGSFLLILSVILNQSPLLFLSSLGAITAILLLVFKDPILGLVAGIQLVANNSVAEGDWIEMPKYRADGDVIEVTLTQVKVRNWDMTITTIPIYALTSDSFTNWRGMMESGGRRIKRAVHIDLHSVRFADAALIERLSKLHLLKDYIPERLKEIEEHNKKNDIDGSIVGNGRAMTNLGLFRRYISEYLKRSNMINHEMTFLVRQLASNELGLPLEIYVFCNDIRWAVYEGVQADIFDHVFAMVHHFDLSIYQRPSSSDFRTSRVLRATADRNEQG